MTAGGQGRGRRGLLLALLCMGFAMGAGAAPAQAERWAFTAGSDTVNNGDVCTFPVHVCQVGRSGLGAAQLGFPVGAAVLDGKVFVPEVLTNRVSVHDATSGEFLFAFGKNVGGNGTSTCTRATGCDVGAVLVCKNGEPSNPIPQCPLEELTVPRDTVLQPFAITASGGQLFIGENQNRVSVWEPDGTFVRAFGRGVGGPGVDSCSTECFPVQGGQNGAGQLWAPASIAVSGGEAYVADANRRVSVFDATTGTYKRAYGKDVGGAGVHVCTTTCAPGAEGGGGGTGPLDYVGQLVASGGLLYVADTDNHRIGVYDAATGAFVRTVGAGLGTGAGQLVVPGGLALTGGELFVAELGAGRVSVFNAASGTFLRALGQDVGGAGTTSCTSSCQAGSPDPNGSGLAAPSGIGVGGGRLFVASSLLATLTAVDAVSGAPHFIAGASVRTGGGTESEICREDCQAARGGSAPGQLFSVGDVTTSGGELFVAEPGNSRISVFDVATGRFLRAFGADVGGPGVDTCTDPCTFGTNGDGAGELQGPVGVTVVDGELFVSEEDNARVSVFDPATGAFLRALGKDVGGPGVHVCTTSCQAGAVGPGAGEMDNPKSLAVAGDRVFVADYANARVTVLDATTGAFVHAWGGGVDGSGGDVCTTTCQAGTEGGDGGELDNPTGMAAAGGEVFVAEDRNYRVSVFDAATGQFLRAYGKDVGGAGTDVCTTSCTNGNLFLAEGKKAGGLVNPGGLAIVAGELFVGDTLNHRVSVFDAASGAFKRAFGKDVGGPGVDTCTTVCTIGDSIGPLVGRLPFAYGVAVAGDRRYVTTLVGAHITAFTASSDVTAPDTSITSGPTGVVEDTTPTFGFTSPDGSAVFECRVDSDSFRPCTSQHTTQPLRNGPHTFQVRAVDPAWNFDASAASRSFTVDVPPETTITAGPGATNDRTPDFSFVSSEPGSTFRCRVDGGTWRSCTSPTTLAQLDAGSHTFEVRATDPAGLTDPTPAKRTFVVDLVAPKATITGGPGTTNDTTPSFTFTSSEAGSTFECRVDGAPFASCTSPWSTPELGQGSHTFDVRATDPAGNRGTAVRRTFTVDTAPPDTSLTSGPTRTYDETPTFGFESTEGGERFECRIDGGTFRSCPHPYTAPELSPGSHTIEVRALDAAGNADPTPATRTFTVLRS